MPEYTARSSLFLTEVKRRRGSAYQELKTEKRNQYIFSASILTCILFAIHFCKYYQMTMYNLAAILNGIFFAHFFVIFFHISYSSEKLHFIRVKRRKSSMSKHLFLPYDTESDKTKPLDSVSALIGLRGSNAEKAVSSLAFLVIGNSWLALATNIIQTDDYYLNIAMFFGYYGLFLIMTWQLEFDLNNDILHCFGLTSASICAFGGFMVQQNFSWFSLGLLLVALLHTAVFVIVKKTQFAKRNIHYQSLMLLTFEAFALFNTAVACSCFLFYLEH